MSVQTMIQEINAGQLAPIYLVVGTEKYLQDQVKAALFNQSAKLEMADMNVISFDVNELDSLDILVEEAETLPFFGEQRFIFVENPSFLTAEKKSGSDDKNIEGLINYLENPLESTVLVFFATYPKLDERKKVTKKLKSKAKIIDAQPVGEKEVRQILVHSIENAHVKMSREAIDLLLRLTGYNLSNLMSELDKILLYAKNQEKISVADITQLVPKTLEDNIFEMTEFVLQGKIDASLRLYDDLVIQGEEMIKIIAILISQIRLLLQVKLLVKQGYQQANIAETLKVHPYRIKLAMQQSKKMSEHYLANLFKQMIDLDYQVKSGQMDKHLAFQLFLLQMKMMSK